MGFVVQRRDGTTDGLGDHVVFETEERARAAAETAFGRDPASDGPEGVWAWLEVVETGATMFAAVGNDGTREVVWGIGETAEAALEDAASQADGSFNIGTLETHAITAAQAAVVASGDVSWPIQA